MSARATHATDARLAGPEAPLPKELLTASEPLVPVILGATGSGKTDVASRVAQHFGGEVIVADSRQVHRGLDIGSNKPTPEERARAPFHLVDVVDTAAKFTAYDFVHAARQVVDREWGVGRLPVVEGATMLYVRALVEGFNLADVPPDAALRAELEAETTDELVSRLHGLDPDAEVDTQNRVRLVRAIEVVVKTGLPLSAARQRIRPPWRVIKLGLDVPLRDLDARLAARTRVQLQRGLVHEVVAALEAGVPRDAQPMSGVGAADVLAFLGGAVDEESLPERITESNRRLARKQLRWLRADRDISWFDARDDPVPKIVDFVEGLLR